VSYLARFPSAARVHVWRTSTATATAFVAVALASFGCGSSSTGTSAKEHASPTPAQQRERAPHIVAKLEPYRLPRAVSGEALTKRGGEILVLGGLDSIDTSTSEIVALSGGLSPRRAGTLSEAKHDLAAVQLARRTLVLGGGAASELDAAEALSAENSGTRIGRLPSARSDLSAVTVGHAAFVLGGYDGNEPLADVLRTIDGSRYSTIGQLPVPFRYAAVAVLGTHIYTFGGELANGRASPLAYVLGGRSRGVALRRIVAFDPASGLARPAGWLPLAVTNAAAIEADSTGYLIGGIGSIEQALDTVIAVRLATG